MNKLVVSTVILMLVGLDAEGATCPTWVMVNNTCPTFNGAEYLDMEINPPSEDTYAYCKAIGGFGGAIRPSGLPGAPLHPLRCRPVPAPNPAQ